MFEGPRVDWLRRFSSEDVAAIGIRTGLAAAGPLGAIVAEFITQFVPNQRLDRLSDFTEQLAERLTGLETAFQARIGESAAYASLVEQATLAAVRAADRNRRRDLADLLRTGLSRAEAELLGHEALLRLLERLNEVQIIILIGYAFRPTYNDPEYQAFAELHPGVFDLAPPTLGDSEDTQAPWALREHYELELKTLGLLKNRTIAESNEYTEITTMGEMLLAAIGRTPRRTPG
jgi:hypothetical protein